MDLSIDEKKAQAWVEEVNAELELVETLIGQVESFMGVIEEETDPVMVILKNAGNKVSTYGGLLKKAFSGARDGLKEAVATLIKHQMEVLAQGKDYDAKMGAN